LALTNGHTQTPIPAAKIKYAQLCIK
jgi:hypothetical protein